LHEKLHYARLIGFQDLVWTQDVDKIRRIGYQTLFHPVRSGLHHEEKRVSDYFRVRAV
jgi:hypothetical protein